MPFTDYFAQPGEPKDCAYKRLQEKYRPKILSIVKFYKTKYSGYLSIPGDIDDLIQVACIAFSEANDRFDLNRVDHWKEPENVFIAFAGTLVNGRLADYLRKNRRQKDTELLSKSDEPIEFLDPCPEVVEKQMFRLMEDHMDKLSPRQHEYLILAVIKGWSTKDIATVKGVSEHTVRSWKKGMRKNLQPYRNKIFDTTGDE